MKGMGAEFADLGRRDVGINPATGELQGGALGPLPIRHHEISTRLGDNDLFTVELDLMSMMKPYHTKKPRQGASHAGASS